MSVCVYTITSVCLSTITSVCTSPVSVCVSALDCSCQHSSSSWPFNRGFRYQCLVHSSLASSCSTIVAAFGFTQEDCQVGSSMVGTPTPRHMPLAREFQFHSWHFAGVHERRRVPHPPLPPSSHSSTAPRHNPIISPLLSRPSHLRAHALGNHPHAIPLPFASRTHVHWQTVRHHVPHRRSVRVRRESNQTPPCPG